MKIFKFLNCVLKGFLLMAILASLFSCGGSGNYKNKPQSTADIIAVSPANSSTKVGLNTNFSITFLHAIDPNSTSNAVFVVKSSSQAAAEAKSKATASDKINLELQTLSTDGKTAVFMLPSGTILDAQTNYQLQVNQSLIKYTSNASIGSGIATISKFTTGTNILPTATIVNPFNGATGVSTAPLIQIAFNQAVTGVNSSNVALYQGTVSSGNTVAIGNIVPGSNNVYNFSPSSFLKQSTTYYIVLGTGIVNNDGNSLAPIIFSFTTGDFDVPRLASVTPANGTTSITITPLIQLMFSEPVTGVNSNNVTLYQGSISSGNTVAIGNIVPGANNTYTFSPVSPLSQLTTYYIVLGSGITDNYGNQLAQTTLSFTTGYYAWTWVSGGNTGSQVGVYGTQGTASTTNISGSRFDSISWTDSFGNLWLFGGDGYDSTGSFEFLNDLWKYSPMSNTWTWVSGSNIGSQSGVYGTQGVASTTNIPGARLNSISWIDSFGNLWLFGGFGYDSTGTTSGRLNDLWEYSPTNNTWTWVSGSNIKNQPGVYGTQGVASATNIPGSRINPISWIDSSGNLWLFGGNSSKTAFLNDLWKYSPTNNTWTWVSGSNTTNKPGVYGTQGVASTTNIPGSRFYSLSWTDRSGNLWLFGGDGYDSTGNFGFLNDLWEYNPTNNTWKWVSGSNTRNQEGVYGTQGIPSTTNIPGARYASISWTDLSGNLWLFGGSNSTPQGGGFLNDLWKYSPTDNTWTWVSGSNAINQGGVYGIQGVISTTNMPGSRADSISWIDSSGNLWLFGGNGYDSTGNLVGGLNDLWKFSFN